MPDRHLITPYSTRRLLLAAAPTAFLSSPAWAQAMPTEVVERFHAVLIEIMRNASNLDVRGRFNRLEPVMQASFDLPAMTRIAAGPAWNGMTPDQQAQLVQAFSEWSISTYANRFNGFSGESFSTAGVTTLRSGDQMVRTALNRVANAPVQLNYLVRQTSDGWRIVDVYLTGTISELASRRAEFAAVLQQGGADRLIAELRRRSAELMRG